MDELSESRLKELKSDFSLKDLSKFSVYQHFEAHNEDYKRNDYVYISVWYKNHAKIAEIFENNIGQKIGFDSSSETWFYEKWYDKYITKQWKQRESEWGESKLIEIESETQEKWSWNPDEESYEYVHLENNNDYGSKTGKKNGISWKEIWHKKPEDSALEKFWISDTAKWGEKEGKTGTKVWGLNWREEGEFFEESSWNEEGPLEWGHVKGKDSNKQWEENWTVTPDKKTNDKWWIEGLKKWGVKTINEGITNFCEEWEEKEGCKRTVTSYDDGLGHKSQITEGEGKDYKYNEEYTYYIEDNIHKTIKKGYSPDGKWESHIVQHGTKHFVKNKGEDANGMWEDEWEDSDEIQRALKKGKSNLWGSWEEEWSEVGGKKTCKKWGEREGEKWTEEWTEDTSKKYCKREQNKGGNIFIQEWKEHFSENTKHTVGKFLENGIVVKEWDAVSQWIPDQLDY